MFVPIVPDNAHYNHTTVQLCPVHVSPQLLATKDLHQHSYTYHTESKYHSLQYYVEKLEEAY